MLIGYVVGGGPLLVVLWLVCFSVALPASVSRSVALTPWWWRFMINRRLREVGATVNPTSATVKNEEGEAVRGRTYTVGLLKETCIPARTLAMAFPKPKLNKRK